VLFPPGLQLPEVFRAALGDLLPTLPSKLDGGGIFRFCQNSEEVASTPDRIMHDQQSPAKTLYDTGTSLRELGLDALICSTSHGNRTLPTWGRYAVGE
jgi:hypothetical protein